jgi:tripartite-type tricarboxylate transporter receptor subunit TctC
MASVTLRTIGRMALSAVSWIFLSASAAMSAWGADDAADFPNKAIRLIVPYQTGGLPDLMARLTGPKLFEIWKQPVVVENRAGAGGIIGTEIVAKAIADGYTLLSVSGNAHTATPAVQLKLPYDTLRDFAGISVTATSAYALVVPPSLNARTVQDLIALAKARPGQLNFASGGIGSGTHFAAELFNELTGIRAVHVAYRGIPDAFTDIVAGRAQFFMSPLASAIPLARDGKLRMLAVSKHMAGFDEGIPTFAESGVRGYDWDGWTGLLAPAKTPRAIINKLNREVSRILNLHDVKQRMTALGVDIEPTTPAQLDKLIADQVALTTTIARKAGIKAD